MRMPLKEATILVVQAGALMLMSILSAPSLALDSGDQSLELQGEALVEIGPFGLDVDIARFFEGADNERLLELEYVRDVARKYSHMGWEEGLKSFSDSR